MRTAFGKLPDGTPVELFTLRNGHGVEARITNYGGILVGLSVPDAAGRPADVVLGCETLADYLAGHPYLGCLCGRYANRIAGGRFQLGGHTYQLAINNGPHSLHGGLVGFDKKVWAAEPAKAKDGTALKLTLVSPHGEEGYPGTLAVEVIYTLTERNELRLDYRASTDRETVLNLTHHGYFNLAGAGAGDILGHVLRLHAEHFTPTDATAIPLGELRAVRGTPMDFTHPIAIGARIEQADEQLRFGRGYDHNFVLTKPQPGVLTLAAEVFEPQSRRTLECWTTEPGVQLYTGNYLDGSVAGKQGRRYGPRTGFCLEAQHFPDSPNQPAFPSTRLRPGHPYHQTTVYKFGVA